MLCNVADYLLLHKTVGTSTEGVTGGGGVFTGGTTAGGDIFTGGMTAGEGVLEGGTVSQKDIDW